MEKNSMFKKVLKGSVSATLFGALCLTGTSFANDQNMQPNASLQSGPVSVWEGCAGRDYTLDLRNHGNTPQTCVVSCKHIVSTERFSVVVAPFGGSMIYGTHHKARCNISCTDQVFGGVTNFYATPYCR